MNLDAFLKESALQDLSWVDEGMLNPGNPTHDPAGEVGSQDIDTKPELEMQWGYGDIDPQFAGEPAGVVKRNIPKEDLADASPVILFARDQQNRGVMGADLLRKLRAKFDLQTLEANMEPLRQQLSLDGIVGCVAVDGRGYKSCHEALRVAALSPFKRHIRYVIGCGCGDPHVVPKPGDSIVGAAVETVDMVADLLDQGKHEVATVSLCRSTMLPILGGIGDLDESEMDSGLIELMNVAELPEEEHDRILESRGSKSALHVLRNAFRAAARVAKLRRQVDYGVPVDASEHMIDVTDQELDLAPVVDMSDLEVDESPGVLEMDDVCDFSPLDIDMGLAPEPEFEGSDIIDFDALQAPLSPLDINMRQDMQV